MQGTQVQSLVGELRSCMVHDAMNAKKNQTKMNHLLRGTWLQKPKETNIVYKLEPFKF